MVAEGRFQAGAPADGIALSLGCAQALGAFKAAGDDGFCGAAQW